MKHWCQANTYIFFYIKNNYADNNIIESSIDGTHMNMKTLFKYILYEDKTVFWPQLLHCSKFRKSKQCFSPKWNFKRKEEVGLFLDNLYLEIPAIRWILFEFWQEWSAMVFASPVLVEDFSKVTLNILVLMMALLRFGWETVVIGFRPWVP